MFKKIISIILVIIMISGVFSTEVFIRTNAQSVSYDSADKYVADCLTYGFINPETGNPELTPYVSNMILRDFTYEILAEAIIDEEQLIYNSVFWNNLRKSLKGEFLEIANWQEAFYIVLLMDYLNYSSNTYEYNDYLIENTVKYADEVYSAIIEYNSDWYEGNVDNLIKNSSLTDAVEFSEKYGYLYKLNKFNTLKEDILKVSQNAWEYYNNLSKALAIREANENRVNFLKSLRNEASDDTYLISAIDKIVDWYTASYATLAFDNAVSVMANYSVSATFDCIVKAFPTLKNIVAALKISTGGLDWLFNSDDLSENNLKILLLYIIHSHAVSVLQDARDNYKNSCTKENASKINNTFICYVDFQNYASYHTKSFISSIFYDGISNKIENIFSDSNKVAYNEFQGYLDQDILYCETVNNNVNTWYRIYQGMWGNDSDFIIDNQGGITPPSIGVTNITLDIYNYTLFSNKSLTVTATAYPLNAEGRLITYYSENTNIAKVDQNGKISPVKEGTVKIYAKTSNGITTSCNITVLPFKCLEKNDNSYKITGYSGNGGSVNIPSNVNGKNITEINMLAFSGNKKITSVTIPNTVTKIGASAFDSCTYLESVTIPESVNRIDYHAFAYCDSLNSVYINSLESWCSIDFGSTSANPLYNAKNLYINGNLIKDITIPNGIISVKNNVFACSKSLTSITIPENVTNIGDRAFYQCDSLKSIDIKGNLKSIGEAAFFECESIDNINLPDSIEIIGESAFSGCASLSSIVIPNNVTTLNSGTFSGCVSLESVVIGDEVTSIADRTFSNCHSIKTIEIGKNLSKIKKEIFGGCKSLVSISVDKDNANYSSENGVLFDKNKTQLIIYPSANANVSYSIPDTVSTVSSSAFSDSLYLKNITIPKSVQVIGNSAFAGCANLTEIVIPDSITTIEEHAFYMCDNLVIFCNYGRVSQILSGNSYEYFCFGDMDDNKLLNSADASIIKKIILDYSDCYFDEKISDINQDNALNILDLIRLKKVIANYIAISY